MTIELEENLCPICRNKMQVTYETLGDDVRIEQKRCDECKFEIIR